MTYPPGTRVCYIASLSKKEDRIQEHYPTQTNIKKFKPKTKPGSFYGLSVGQYYKTTVERRGSKPHTVASLRTIFEENEESVQENENKVSLPLPDNFPLEDKSVRFCSKKDKVTPSLDLGESKATIHNIFFPPIPDEIELSHLFQDAVNLANGVVHYENFRLDEVGYVFTLELHCTEALKLDSLAKSIFKRERSRKSEALSDLEIDSFYCQKVREKSHSHVVSFRCCVTTLSLKHKLST